MDLRRPCRPPLRKPVPSLLSAALLLQAAILGRQPPLSRAQEEEADQGGFLDFRLVNVKTTPSREEVVLGKVLLYGQVTIEFLEDLALTTRSALTLMCSPQTGDDAGTPMPVTTYAYQDIMTLNERVVGFIIEFKILPPIGGGIQCADRVSALSVGPEEPPFDPIPAPAFRYLLAWEIAQNRNTRWLDMTKWRVKLVNVTCDELDVMKPEDIPEAILAPGSGDPDRQCDGKPMPEIDWKALADSAWESPAAKCEFAPAPCVCAAIQGCGWVAYSNGAGQCREGGIVACELCAIQEGCEPTPEELCAMALSPCSCIALTAECNPGEDCNPQLCDWDEESEGCIVKEKKTFTSCSACARQPRCPPVTIQEKVGGMDIEPPQMSVIGSADAGWQVNVTFTRQVWLERNEAEVFLYCRTSTERKESLEVPLEQLTVADNLLFVDLQGIRNGYRRDCDLVIGSGTLRDRDHIPFAGLEPSVTTLQDFTMPASYTITFPDTAEPDLQRFDPENSATDVPLDAFVSAYFNEEMGPGPDAEGGQLLLTELGAELEGGGRKPDVVVARLATMGPRVSFEDNRLKVDLSGHTSPNTLYSLSIPEGAIADKVGNAFSGLPVAKYAFRTVGDNQIRLNEDALPVEVVVGVAVGSAVFLGVCIMGTWICVRINAMKQRVVSYSGDTSSPPVEAPDPDAEFQWGGEKIVVDGDLHEDTAMKRVKSTRSRQSQTSMDPSSFSRQSLTSMDLSEIQDLQDARIAALKQTAGMRRSSMQAAWVLQSPTSPMSPTRAQAMPMSPVSARSQAGPMSPVSARSQAAHQLSQQRLSKASEAFGSSSPKPPEPVAGEVNGPRSSASVLSIDVVNIP